MHLCAASTLPRRASAPVSPASALKPGSPTQQRTRSTKHGIAAFPFLPRPTCRSKISLVTDSNDDKAVQSTGRNFCWSVLFMSQISAIGTRNTSCTGVGGGQLHDAARAASGRGSVRVTPATTQISGAVAGVVAALIRFSRGQGSLRAPPRWSPCTWRTCPGRYRRAS